MSLDLEEIIELIEMHGRTIIDAAICDNCHEPMKNAMLGKLDRMRQLIEMLPDHDEPKDGERIRDGATVVPIRTKGNLQ